MRPARLAVAAVAIAAAFGLSSCMKVEQTASSQKTGRYQGKPDDKPWNSAPLSYGSAKWTKGDMASWEGEIKTRTQNQNENVRIGQ